MFPITMALRWEVEEARIFSIFLIDQKQKFKVFTSRATTDHPWNTLDRLQMSTSATECVLNLVRWYYAGAIWKCMEYTCRTFAQREVTSSVPLVTVTLDSYWVYHKQSLSSGHFLRAHPTTDFLHSCALYKYTMKYITR